VACIGDDTQNDVDQSHELTYLADEHRPSDVVIVEANDRNAR
jgi:hypothetical protein